MRTLWNVTCIVAIAASGYFFVEIVARHPTPFDQKDGVAEIIQDYESGLIQEMSFQNIQDVMGQKEE